MSQTFFSKLDPQEKSSRLAQLGSFRGKVTIWIKGQQNKHTLDTLSFYPERMEVVLESKEDFYPHGTEVLCSFYLKGMTFFSKVIFQKSSGSYNILHFKEDLFKSERRGSYRLLTYPIYDVWAEFDLGAAYEGGKVIDLKTKSSQTDLFKNFLNLVDSKSGEVSDTSNKLKVRIHDLSTTGMGLAVGPLEAPYFVKDITFNNVKVIFVEDSVILPEVKVVYLMDYISGENNIKKFKIGLQFNELPAAADDFLGRKINKLLREIDSNKDFEIFLK